MGDVQLGRHRPLESHCGSGCALHIRHNYGANIDKRGFHTKIVKTYVTCPFMDLSDRRTSARYYFNESLQDKLKLSTAQPFNETHDGITLLHFSISRASAPRGHGTSSTGSSSMQIRPPQPLHLITHPSINDNKTRFRSLILAPSLTRPPCHIPASPENSF